MVVKSNADDFCIEVSGRDVGCKYGCLSIVDGGVGGNGGGGNGGNGGSGGVKMSESGLKLRLRL